MKLLILLGAIASLLILTELALRVGFGLGNPPLYRGDDRIGYLFAPNQQMRRFGNYIRINQYSMRADPIEPRPAPGTLRVFLLGDSLSNGNGWTDQADILSVRIAHYLQRSLPQGYDEVEPLNASANSWGPRNELAYLEQYGTFGSTVLVLLLNTDDLFGTEPTPLQVGRDRNYPNQKPPLAIAEVLGRYFKQEQPIPGLKKIQQEGGDRVGKNLDAINGIYHKVTAEGGQFVLVLSPLKRELPGPRDYEIVARQRLTDWATEAGVPYLDLLETYQQHPEPESLYRDHIHLSPVGNELVSGAIAQTITTLPLP
ncbi:MAG: SGNH/GDSL hydrolase family protein [Phormidesmis sp.]